MDQGRVALPVNSQRWALARCADMGLWLAGVACVAGAFSASDQIRRCLSVLLVAAAWVWLRWQGRLRDHPSFTETELVGLAIFCVIPFAVDGHAQSNVFVSIAPLGAVAALCGKRRTVVLFAAAWVAAYLLGAVIGTGPRALIARHRFDCAEQVLVMVACCAVYYFVALRLGGFWTALDRRVHAAVNEQQHAIDLAEEIRASRAESRPGHRLGELSENELEALRLFTADKSTAEVAAAMFKSRTTIRGYRQKIVKKLDVLSMEQAVSVWAEHDARSSLQ